MEETPSKLQINDESSAPSPGYDAEIEQAFCTPSRRLISRNNTDTQSVSSFFAISSPKSADRAINSTEGVCGASASSSCTQGVHEVCAICLEVLAYTTLADGSTSLNESECVATRCKHIFHKTCLLETKLHHKSECPCCRSLLTPPPTSAFLSMSTAPNISANSDISVSRLPVPPQSGQSYSDYFRPGMRASYTAAIVGAASRGREAVQRRLREQAQQRQQQEQQ